MDAGLRERGIQGREKWAYSRVHKSRNLSRWYEIFSDDGFNNKDEKHTEVLKPLKISEDEPDKNMAWSNPVTHTEVFCVPRNFVGVNAERAGS